MCMCVCAYIYIYIYIILFISSSVYLYHSMLVCSHLSIYLSIYVFSIAFASTLLSLSVFVALFLFFVIFLGGDVFCILISNHKNIFIFCEQSTLIIALVYNSREYRGCPRQANQSAFSLISTPSRLFSGFSLIIANYFTLLIFFFLLHLS